MDDRSLKPYPFKFEELSPEEKALVHKVYPSYITFVKVGPKGYVVMKRFEEDAANIYNMPLRSDDVFVASFQRSGTTWTQELVWLIANNFDYETAAKISLPERYPFLELFMALDEDDLDGHIKSATAGKSDVNIEILKQMLEAMAKPASRMLSTAPSPRFIKTHLPMSLLPPGILDTAKVVYVARDPRDVAVSSYHHGKLFNLSGFGGEFKDFWNIFHKSLFLLTPLFEHLKEAWEKRSHPNMLFLFYEELLKDLPAAVRRVGNFLGKDVNEEEMKRLCNHLSIDQFKKNKSVNLEELRNIGALAPGESFIRKGKAGGWRNYFDEETTQEAERWIADNLRDTDLRFPSMQN